MRSGGEGVPDPAAADRRGDTAEGGWSGSAPRWRPWRRSRPVTVSLGTTLIRPGEDPAPCWPGRTSGSIGPSGAGATGWSTQRDPGKGTQVCNERGRHSVALFVCLRLAPFQPNSVEMFWPAISRPMASALNQTRVALTRA